MLVLGPTQSGKTSGLLVPQVLLAPGPAVVVTTKGVDIYEPTAQTRSRTGELWHYSPSTLKTPLPGATQLRWSPLTGAEDWDTAVRIAAGFIDIADTSHAESGSSQFFKERATYFITAVIHAAALANHDIGFVLEVFLRDRAAEREVETILYRDGSRYAQKSFGAYLASSEEKRRDDIAQTADNAFRAFRLESAQASATNPNFNIERFIETGDTVYITAPTDDQRLVADLIVAFLAQLRRARFALFDADRQQGRTRPAMFWALDELASMAPIKEFPSIVSQSASQGLTITACLQDLAQAQRIWGDESKGFLGSYFRAAVVMPGITNEETNRTLAALGGKEWLQLINTSSGSTTSSGYSVTYGGTGFGAKPGSVTESFGTSHTTGQSTQWAQQDRITQGDVFRGNLGTLDKTRYPTGSMIYLEPHAGLHQAQAIPYYERPFRDALEVNRRRYLEERRPDNELLPSPELRAIEAPPAPTRRRRRAID